MNFLAKIGKKILPADIFEELLILKNNYSLLSAKNQNYKKNNIALCCNDGRFVRYGLADRLRGMVTVYAYAKANGVPFRIEHIKPFELADYFAPNKYDWRLREGEITYNLYYANPIFFYSFSDKKKAY